MGKYPIKTEDDKEKKEFANRLVSNFLKRMDEIANERKLDKDKDFMKIMRQIKRENINGIE